MAEETKAQTLATQREPRPLAKIGFTFLPQTWEQLYNYAKEIAQTDFVPNDLRGKPGAVLACWQFGQEVGLAPMAALQSIAVINGRPSLWGDGALAVVRANPLCEYVRELRPDEALKAGYGECTVKRRDDDVPITRRFTKEEAEIAGLWGGKSTDAEFLENAWKGLGSSLVTFISQKQAQPLPGVLKRSRPVAQLEPRSPGLQVELCGAPWHAL